jgi:hypothetical protein
MLRVNGASRSGGVGVRFIHRWQHARVRAVRPGIRANVSDSNARSAQPPWKIRVFEIDPETGIRNPYLAKRPR